MTRVRFVFLVALIAMLVLPVTALAQPPVCAFYGSVTVDGKAAADGAAVGAWIDGKLITTATVDKGQYVLKVVQPSGSTFEGKVVGFGIIDKAAVETSVWNAGGVKMVNLTAAAGAPPTAPPPAATPTTPPVVLPTATPGGVVIPTTIPTQAAPTATAKPAETPKPPTTGDTNLPIIWLAVAIGGAAMLTAGVLTVKKTSK